MKECRYCHRQIVATGLPETPWVHHERMFGWFDTDKPHTHLPPLPFDERWEDVYASFQYSDIFADHKRIIFELRFEGKTYGWTHELSKYEWEDLGWTWVSGLLQEMIYEIDDILVAEDFK